MDGGGSTTMAFEGALLNRPSDRGGERAVAESLNIFYFGVYALPPASEVVSPNGDGVADAQQLEYKLVRPSSVTATLLGPDNVERNIDAAARGPGRYPLTWTGLKPDGTLEPEGRWRWRVTATDNLGNTSTTDRVFWLNNTLGSLSVNPIVWVGRAASNLKGTFALAHAATVRVTVERSSGAVVRTVLRRSFPEGPVRVGWDGRDTSRAFAYRGRYVLRVRATNSLGSVDLTRAFTLRRL
jgi:hypothetical protein